jgi:putative DNA primase/helicase
LGWLGWDGRRWIAGNCGVVERLAKATVRGIYGEVSIIEDSAKRNEVARHAKASESRQKIDAMIGLAKSDERVLTSLASLDNDPNLFNVRNGTIDLETGKLLPHRRTDLLTKLAPVDYDRTATCPRWKSFLREIMSGNTRLVGFIQRAVGATLLGRCREHVVHVLHGTGANGKSTFLEVLLHCSPSTDRPPHRSC